MTSMLCERVDGGAINVLKEDLVEQLVIDADDHIKTKLMSRTKLRDRLLNQQRPKSTPSGVRLSPDSSSLPRHRPSHHDDVDANAMIGHSLKLQDWLSEKRVKSVQNSWSLGSYLTKKMYTRKGEKTLKKYDFPEDHWEKTDREARKMKKKYTTLLDIEDSFVKELDDSVKYKENVLDVRKREILHKNWTDRVYEPLRREIIKEMEGPNYAELDRRKRELYRDYLEFANEKGHVFLDTYPADEYYALGLHATRPALFKGLQAETKRLRDPLISQAKQRAAEDRVILKCNTGIRFNDKDIETIRLPPLPLVPLGRHGTECATWLAMPLTDIESSARRASRRPVLSCFSDSHVNLNEWATVPSDMLTEVLDGEFQIPRRKRLPQNPQPLDLSHRNFKPVVSTSLNHNIAQVAYA